MEIIALRSVLLPQLAFVAGVAEKKATIPILSNLIITTEAADVGCTLYATDLDIWLTTYAGARVVEPGTACIPAKRLLDIVKALPEDEVTIKTDDKAAEIRCRGARFRLTIDSPENFPERPASQVKPWQVPALTLQRLIDRTQFAIAQHESRYTLHGAKLEINNGTIRLIATDGHRLAFASAPFEQADCPSLNVLVAKGALAKLSLLVEDGSTISMGMHDNWLICASQGRTLMTRLLIGQFPDYTQVLPNAHPHRVAVKTGELTGALKRVMLMADSISRIVKLQFDPTQVTISAQTDSGVATEIVPVEYDGTDLTIGFNATYLLDGLNAINDNVVLELKDAGSALQMLPEGAATGDYRYVVMPARI